MRTTGLYKTETRDSNQYTLQDLATLYKSEPITVRSRLIEGGIKPTALWDRPGKGRKPELYTDLLGDKFESILQDVSKTHKRKRVSGKAVTSGARVSPRTQGIILEAQIRLLSHLLTCEKTGGDLVAYIESYQANAVQALYTLRSNIAAGNAVSVDREEDVVVDASVHPYDSLSFDTEASAETAQAVFVTLGEVEDTEDGEERLSDQIVFEDTGENDDDDEEVELYVF